jgi:AcrR family transcriptional regulator
VAAPHAHADVRAAIVFAAFESIAELGFDGLRMRHVAAEAGLDEASLQAHFATKPELAAAVLDYISNEFEATMRSDGTAIERFHFHLDALGRLVEERPVLFIVLAELDVRARRDPLIRSVIERYERRWRGALAALFREGHEQGAWADGIDPHAAGELVIVVVKGIRIAPASAVPALALLKQLVSPSPESPSR